MAAGLADQYEGGWINDGLRVSSGIDEARGQVGRGISPALTRVDGACLGPPNWELTTEQEQIMVEQYWIAVVSQPWLIVQGKNEMMMSQIRVEGEGERKRIWQL